MGFTHVDDVVRTVEMAADHELDDVYNVGTGQRVSFDELAEMLNGELGAHIDLEYVENPTPEDIYAHNTCADASNLRAATCWEPEVSLEGGLRRVCAVYD